MNLTNTQLAGLLRHLERDLLALHRARTSARHVVRLSKDQPATILHVRLASYLQAVDRAITAANDLIAPAANALARLTDDADERDPLTDPPAVWGLPESDRNAPTFGAANQAT